MARLLFPEAVFLDLLPLRRSDHEGTYGESWDSTVPSPVIEEPACWLVSPESHDKKFNTTHAITIPCSRIPDLGSPRKHTKVGRHRDV